MDKIRFKNLETDKNEEYFIFQVRELKAARDNESVFDELFNTIYGKLTAYSDVDDTPLRQIINEVSLLEEDINIYIAWYLHFADDNSSKNEIETVYYIRPHTKKVPYKSKTPGWFAEQ